MKGAKRSNRHFIVATILLVACEKTPAVADAGPPARTRSAAVGRVTGTVRTSAASGTPRPLPDSVKKVCGETAPDVNQRVAEDGALVNAVVWVEDARDTPLPSGPAQVLDQKGCLYFPAVLVAHTGAKLKVRNSDPLLHNVRAAGLFNEAMPIENLSIERTMPKETGPVKIVCDVHPWMRADVMVLPHAQYAITDEHGHFTLADVEAGTRPLHVWHATLGDKRVNVEVPPGGEGALETSL